MSTDDILDDKGLGDEEGKIVELSEIDDDTSLDDDLFVNEDMPIDLGIEEEEEGFDTEIRDQNY